MAYDKVKKAKADATRYWRNKDVISAKRRLQRLSNKPVIRQGEPSMQELRSCIEQGYCWWCQRGGWRRLAKHTAAVHQIYANDLRNIAIMLKRKPTCVKEESEVMSDNRRRAMALGHAKAPDWRLAQGIKHEYSEAGLVSMKGNQRHMMESMTPEARHRAIEKTIERTSKPHPCPVCGAIIPRAKPICCSGKCRNRRLADVGREQGLRLPHEHFIRMGEIIKEKYSKPHSCLTCGKLIPKSRPKYCSPECGSQIFKLPLHTIATRYLSGESSIVLSNEYGCCDHTIRRHLRKAGIKIRVGNSHDGANDTDKTAEIAKTFL